MPWGHLMPWGYLVPWRHSMIDSKEIDWWNDAALGHICPCCYTSTCPYVRGHTCKKNKIQTASQKQPHVPFLRSCVPVCACPYVHGCTCKPKKKQKNFKPRARNNNHTGRSFALACPYVRARLCVARKFAYRSYDSSQFSFNGQLFN